MNVEKLAYDVGKLQQQLVNLQNEINSLRNSIIKIKTNEEYIIYEQTVIEEMAKASYEDGQRQFANWDQNKWQKLSDGRRFNESKHMLAAVNKLNEIICKSPSKDAVAASVFIERYIGSHVARAVGRKQ